MNTFFIVVTWFIVIALKAYMDFHQIEIQKKNIKHGFEILLVAMVAFFHQWIAGVNKIEEWQFAGTILIFQASSYFLFFDASLNLMRGREIFYYGKEAWTDRLFQKLGMGAYVMSKIFALVLMVTAVIQLTKI